MAEKEIPAGADLTKLPTISLYKQNTELAETFKKAMEESPHILVIQEKPRWIPCRERMPENREYVIFTINRGSPMVGFGYRMHNIKGELLSRWFDKKSGLNFSDYDVKAWMPMPSAYEPSEKSNTMTLEESFNFIKEEFKKEVDKRKELLDKIADLQDDNDQLTRDLKAYRSFYTMKNEVCKMCEFVDECIDANTVEGKRLCASFHAKVEDEE